MTNERRSRLRANLQAPLFLLPHGATALVETQTENIHVGGFFCYSEHLFVPGECLKFLLILSATAGHANGTGSGRVYLAGVVEAMHVTVGTSKRGFGVGCRVSSYRVLPEASLATREEILAALVASASTDETGRSPAEDPFEWRQAAFRQGS